MRCDIIIDIEEYCIVFLYIIVLLDYKGESSMEKQDATTKAINTLRPDKQINRANLNDLI